MGWPETATSSSRALAALGLFFWLQVRVEGLGFRVYQGLGFRVCGLGFTVGGVDS